jgi:hypothetical protein
MKKGYVVVLVVVAVAVGALVGVTRAGSTDRASVSEARHDAAERAQALAPQVQHVLDGEAWGAAKYTNDLGESCVEIRSPAGWRSGRCAPAGRVPEVTVGGTTTHTYVYGVVPSAVNAVEIIADDCSVVRAKVRDGVVLHVTSADRSAPAIVRTEGTGQVNRTVRLDGLKAGAAAGC